MATGLTTSLLYAGDFEYEHPCSECQEHGLNSDAVYYCQQCTRQFCNLCIKQHDRFNRRHHILGSEKRDNWGKVKNTCKLHPGEELMVFCSDHGQTCCVTCQKQIHRTCQQVIRLQKVTFSSEISTHSQELQGSNIPKKSELAKTPLVIDTSINKPFTVTKMIQLNVRTKDDKCPCSIAGITVLPEGEIIISDFENKKLKLLSADYSLVHRVRVPLGSWDICAVSPNQVAFCNCSQDIQFFKVRNKKLKMDRKFHLEHACYYVSCSKGYLYVSSGRTVYQYTLSGQRLEKIYTTGGGHIWGIATSADGDRHYIIDANLLLTLDIKGRVLEKLVHELKCPRGFCVSPSGYVFVCGNSCNTIIQVDSEGKHKLAILGTNENFVCRPQSVCFDSRTSSLLVGQDETDDLLLLQIT